MHTAIDGRGQLAYRTAVRIRGRGDGLLYNLAAKELTATVASKKWSVVYAN